MWLAIARSLANNTDNWWLSCRDTIRPSYPPGVADEAWGGHPGSMVQYVMLLDQAVEVVVDHPDVG